MQLMQRNTRQTSKQGSRASRNSDAARPAAAACWRRMLNASTNLPCITIRQGCHSLFTQVQTHNHISIIMLASYKLPQRIDEAKSQSAT
jgi:hypothetical protein